MCIWTIVCNKEFITIIIIIIKDCPSFTDHTQQIDMNEIMNPQRNVKKTEATI